MKNWKQERNLNLNNVITNLHVVAKKSENHVHRKDAQVTCDYFVRNGTIPLHMKMRAIDLIKLNFTQNPLEKPKGKRKWSEHYLYAISNGESLKIGYSVDPKTRLRSINTSSPEQVKLVWKTLCGYNDEHARKQESKIHRALKGHKIKGEWFKFDCLYICRGWKVNQLTKYHSEYIKHLESESKTNYVEEELDRQFLFNH